MNEEILRNLNYRLDKALNQTRQIVEDEQINEQIDRCKLKAEQYVAKNPLKSIAGGLLAGYVIGKIFSND